MSNTIKRIWLGVLIILAAILLIGFVSDSNGQDDQHSGENRRVQPAASSSTADSSIGFVSDSNGQDDQRSGENRRVQPAASSSAADSSTVSSSRSVFDGDCGVAVSAEMGETIIGFPELTISITNTTSKTISAIQFYAVPLDVYGEEISGWTAQNRLYTDTAIEAGASTSISYQLIEDSVKTVRLYIYSVFFSDGTEWGNREATNQLF